MCQSAFLSGPSLHHDKQHIAGIQAHRVLAVWPTSFFPRHYAAGGMHRTAQTRQVFVLLYFSHPAMKSEGRVWFESNFFVLHDMLCKAQSFGCQ
jgi:hypothetical protein